MLTRERLFPNEGDTAGIPLYMRVYQRLSPVRISVEDRGKMLEKWGFHESMDKVQSASTCYAYPLDFNPAHS